MPKTVLVPLDGSEFAQRSLPAAAALVRRAGAEALVLTARWGGVVTEPHHSLRDAAHAAGIERLETMIVEDQLAASAVVSTIEDRPDPAVCLATHARGAVGHAVLGGVAEEILRQTDAPVVLVGPSARSGPVELHELVLCVDGSEVGSTIAPVAAAWAQSMQLGVVVVGVADSAEARTPGSPSNVSLPDLECVARVMQASSVEAECRLLHSTHPAVAITEFAAGRTGAWLALATHGWTGLARLTAGSVTMEVVRRAPVPVMVHRPTNLVT